MNPGIRRFLQIWHFNRILRLVIGTLFMAEAWAQRSLPIATLAAVLLLMAAFDWGCGSARGCAPLPTKKTPDPLQPISYEEIQ